MSTVTSVCCANCMRVNIFFYFFLCSALSNSFREGQNDTFSRTSQLLFNECAIFGALTGSILPPAMLSITQKIRLDVAVEECG